MKTTRTELLNSFRLVLNVLLGALVVVETADTGDEPDTKATNTRNKVHKIEQ